MPDPNDTSSTDDQPKRRSPMDEVLGLPPRIASPTGTPGVIGVPPINRPVYSQPSTQGPTSPAPPTADKTPMGAPAQPMNPHLQEVQRMEDTGSGVQQVQAKHPFWGGVLRGLDVAGSIINPAITAQIPGTTLHHNMLIGQQEHLANEDVGREEHEAQAQEANARSQALLRPPKETPEEEAYGYEKGQGKNPVEAYTGIKQIGQEVKPPTHEQEEMEYATLRNQAASSPLTPEQQTKLNDLQTRFSVGSQGAQQIEGRILGELNANPHTKAAALPPELHVLPTDTLTEANAKYNAAKDRVGAATNQQHISVSVAGQADKGAQSIFVPNDPNDPSKGYSLQYVKPGQSVGAGGVTAGGLSTQNANATKMQQEIEGAKDYANGYVSGGAYTGAGDEALQEQFFTLAKPSTGFRMTQPQIKQLQQSESWIEQAKAKGTHALSGGWFSDEQRQQIVKTMNDLAAAKEKAHGIGQLQSGGSGLKITRDANGRIIGVE